MFRYLSFAFIFLTFGVLQTACLQTNNSNAGDDNLYGPASVEFKAAKTVFASKCTGCHSFEAMSEEELLAEPDLISAGQALNSAIYYRSKNSLGTLGPKNMPTDKDLTTAEVEAIAAWVNSL